MFVLGLAGGCDLAYEPGLREVGFHDSAAVLLEDGKIVAAIEEERLNRIKHTDCFAIEGIDFCLKTRGISLENVQEIAVYFREDYFDLQIRIGQLRRLLAKDIKPARDRMNRIISERLGASVRDKIVFVRHHRAHAASTFFMSGFDRSLITVVDGRSEDNSCSVYTGEGVGITEVYGQGDSIGDLYTGVISFLGYNSFDEYKVMGLAPYGDPARFRPLFERIYHLDSDGRYFINLGLLAELFSEAVGSRLHADESSAEACDLAAALQETTERLVFHVLEHHRATTKQRNICLAGGVAQNCTMNGRLLTSGLFENVFVQPAAHDAGAALGAALLRHHEITGKRSTPKLRDLYWGTNIEASAATEAVTAWRDFVTSERPPKLYDHVAKLIADGAVVGWVQGRSEFGPRALGNRSILADPRPAKNKDIINAMVKKREAFRPFAPSVLEEDAKEIFIIPEHVRELPFMIFVVDVRDTYREVLGAVTHVDGSARVQTVSRDANERYWELISAFKRITGVPVLLNTSFNNNAEPIVDSVEDALTCFLTTKIDYVVIDDHVVSKRSVAPEALLDLFLHVPDHFAPTAEHIAGSEGRALVHHVQSVKLGKYSIPISREMFELLTKADGSHRVNELVGDDASSEARNRLASELQELWALRAVVLSPTVRLHRG